MIKQGDLTIKRIVIDERDRSSIRQSINPSVTQERERERERHTHTHRQRQKGTARESVIG